MLLLNDAAVELVARGLLFLEDRVAPFLEGGEALGRAGAWCRDRATPWRERVFQEAAVVADQHEGRARGLEQCLEALDRRHVEMVGRLVEHEDVGLGRQHAGKCCAPALAARQPGRLLLAGEPETFQQEARAVRIIARREPGLDERPGGGEAGKVGLLRQIADGRRRLDEAAAAVGLGETGGDLEQRRLARAVPPDQAQPLAGRDRQLGAVEQRRAAEREMDVLEQEERRCHGRIRYSMRATARRSRAISPRAATGTTLIALAGEPLMIFELTAR